MKKAPFFQHLQQSLEPLYSNPHILDDIYAGLECSKRTTFRFNTLSSSANTRFHDKPLQALKQELQTHSKKHSDGWNTMTPCPFYKAAYHCSPQVSHLGISPFLGIPSFKQGKVSLQGWSSMIPPLVLQPQVGNTVLDMCAAPGGKTTLLFEMMKGQGKLIAVELDANRFSKLQKLVHKSFPLHYSSITLLHGDSTRISKEKLQVDAFDCILLDTPCSGEGILNSQDRKTYRHYNNKSIQQCVQIQRSLLDQAYQLLKPHGHLVYSTCTLNIKENEENIEWFLNRYPDMSVCALPSPFQDYLDRSIDVCKPNEFHSSADWPVIQDTFRSSRLYHSLKNMLRVFPSAVYDGFFVAKLQKLQV